MSATKSLGKLSSTQLVRARNAFSEIERLGELSGLLRDKVRFRRLIENPRFGFNWAWGYELPFKAIIGAMLWRIGGAELIDRIKSDPDPNELLLNLNENDELLVPEHLRTGEALVLAGMLVVLVRNIDCVGTYGVTLNELVGRASRGSDESFIRAIEIDPSVLTGPTGMHRMSKMVALGDIKMLRRVQKAFSGPHKGRRVYRDLRTVTVMLREAGAFETASTDDIHEVIVNQLGLYEQRAGDPYKGLITLLRRWQEDASRT